MLLRSLLYTILGGFTDLPTTRDMRAEICNLLSKPGTAIRANAINGSLKFDLMVQRTTRADISREKPKSYLGSLFMYPPQMVVSRFSPSF